MFPDSKDVPLHAANYRMLGRGHSLLLAPPFAKLRFPGFRVPVLFQDALVPAAQTDPLPATSARVLIYGRYGLNLSATSYLYFTIAQHPQRSPRVT